MHLGEAIRSSYVSRGLSQDESDVLIGIAEEMNYEPNEQILREFEPANDIYLLLEGTVRVVTSEGDLITRLYPNAVFGEMAIFQAGPRTASVESEKTCRLARISSEKLDALLESNPEIGVRILKNIGGTLCERLRSTNLQLSAVLAAL